MLRSRWSFFRRAFYKNRNLSTNEEKVSSHRYTRTSTLETFGLRKTIESKAQILYLRLGSEISVELLQESIIQKQKALFQVGEGSLATVYSYTKTAEWMIEQNL